MKDGTNPTNVDIPAMTSGQITSVSNPAYYQRVTVSQDGTQLGQFNGTGENVPMKVQNGSETLNVSSKPDASTISFFFEYSEDGASGQFNPAIVQPPGYKGSPRKTVVTITSEDSTDNDDNDTTVTFIYHRSL